MKEIKKITKLIPFLLILIAVTFNLWTLVPELSIQSDLNDNIFQLGLINRMNQVWEKGNLSDLIDHWVPNWADGYPLPFYYSHLPHLVTVASYKILNSFLPLQLFNYFHLLQYLILAFTPFAFYLGARKFGFSKLTSGLIALFSSQLLTDGLYGIDVSSYVWRGYGLSLQALSVFFLPLALGFTWQAVKENKKYLAAIGFLVACLASHLATGYIGLLSCLLIPLALIRLPKKNWLASWQKVISKPKCLSLIKNYLRLFLVFGMTFILLSYWFIPLFLNNQYHAVSFWDPPSKWFSYGFVSVINLFLNGDLLDFDRLPILTFLTILGFLIAAFRAQKPKYRFFFFLFPFWLILFFGKPFFGNLINFFPLLKDYHLHRFIIGVHLASIFLIGIGLNWLIKRILKLKFSYDVTISLCIFLILIISLPVFRQTFNYLDLNKRWLPEANQEFIEDWTDLEKITQKLNELPKGRIYAGRPGNWGRSFKAGPTPVYMALSARGFEIGGFLPETWSLNSDPEQFFNEQLPEHYNLYNIRYLISPLDYSIPSFAKEIAIYGNYKLSEVETTGYFDLGYSDLTILSSKENLFNITHSWIISPWVKQKQFPALILKGQSDAGRQIKMIDEANYQALSQEFNLFANPVFSQEQPFKTNPQGKILQEEVNFQEYKASIEIDEACQDCLVVFKMTYHPNWQATIDNQPVQKIMVFPSFMAIKVNPGKHQISFKYQPSSVKPLLLVIAIFILIVFLYLKKRLLSNYLIKPNK